MIQEFETWLHQRDYKLNTVNGIINTINRFIQWCNSEAIQPEKASYNDLLSFIKHSQSQTNSIHYINQKLTVLKTYYNFLIETGKRTDNPALELRIRNQIKKVPHNLLNREQLEEMYKQYPTNGVTKKRNKVVLGLLIYQGLNTAELAALEPKDVKLEEGKIYVPSTGRTNSRVLKLEANQIMQLQNYLQNVRTALLSMTDKTSDKLFISVGEGDRLSNTFTQMLKSIKKINPNVKDINQIRASVITEWLKEHNIRQVQYMTGHRYVSSTDRYRVDKLEGLQEILENLHPLK